MKINGMEVVVIQGDITEVTTEAIVNAANNRFLMGGGVAGIIKKKGGKIIEEEAVKQGPLRVGESVITSAGKLKAKYVIHSATMAMDFKTDEEIIRKATYSALLCAQANKIESIAFCALGCGVGGFSYEAVSKIMAQEIFRYMQEVKEKTLKKISFVLNAKKPFDIFNKNVVDYLNYMSKKMSQGPFLTVDGIVQYQGGVVMIERSNPPLGWALPGGFVDYGESVEEAVIREIKEETSLDFIDIRQFKVYSKSNRDPRFHTVSVVFTGKGQGRLKAQSDAKGAKVFKPGDLPGKIAFDHKKVIEDYSQSKNKLSI
ncbi:MAG: macro domain-containing protein [Candidatus Omnitrophica bacterium]|nr:macro domain-containing protein [Candidatus Omnitrophota bacterium]MBU2044772.1 macro domain-containing protein [Candidatus Omnitrophota bacterium]MBU2251597.1 macro domain-containing protein [Candidatus Omnitrophota bacterium]